MVAFLVTDFLAATGFEGCDFLVTPASLTAEGFFAAGVFLAAVFLTIGAVSGEGRVLELVVARLRAVLVEEAAAAAVLALVRAIA